MNLVIAEKPSVARSIATVIGADEKQNGYWQGGGYLVSWCIGHLVSFAEAGQYDEKYCKWKYEDLPILPQPAPGRRKSHGTGFLLFRLFCLVSLSRSYFSASQQSLPKIRLPSHSTAEAGTSRMECSSRFQMEPCFPYLPAVKEAVPAPAPG